MPYYIDEEELRSNISADKADHAPNPLLTLEDMQNSVDVPEQDSEGRTFVDTVKDIGITALKGAVALPQGYVGLMDMPTGGHVGKALEDYVGYDPAGTQEFLDTLYSDKQREANEYVSQGDGIIDTFKRAMERPSVIAHAAEESIPSMLGGLGVAKLLLKGLPKLGGIIAGAAGEGAMSAGQTAESIRNQNADDLLTGKQSAISAASGIATGVLGIAGGKLAKRLGIIDPESLMAEGKLTKELGQQMIRDKSMVRNVAESMLSEGLFEEFPQSAQEKIAENKATGKPWDEGVGNAAVLGALAGSFTGAMGAGGGRILDNISAKTEAKTLAPEELTQMRAGIYASDDPTEQLGVMQEILAAEDIHPDTKKAVQQIYDEHQMVSGYQKDLDSSPISGTKWLMGINTEMNKLDPNDPVFETLKGLQDTYIKNTPKEVINYQRSIENGQEAVRQAGEAETDDSVMDAISAHQDSLGQRRTDFEDMMDEQVAGQTAADQVILDPDLPIGLPQSDQSGKELVPSTGTLLPEKVVLQGKPVYSDDGPVQTAIDQGMGNIVPQGQIEARQGGDNFETVGTPVDRKAPKNPPKKSQTFSNTPDGLAQDLEVFAGEKMRAQVATLQKQNDSLSNSIMAAKEGSATQQILERQQAAVTDKINSITVPNGVQPEAVGKMNVQPQATSDGTAAGQAETILGAAPYRVTKGDRSYPVYLESYAKKFASYGYTVTDNTASAGPQVAEVQQADAPGVQTATSPETQTADTPESTEQYSVRTETEPFQTTTPKGIAKTLPDKGNGLLSTRRPTGAKVTEDPLMSVLTVAWDVARGDVATLKKMMKAMLAKGRSFIKASGKTGTANDPVFKHVSDDPVEQAESMIQQMTSNLLAVYDSIPEVVRNRTRRWYDGANKISKEWAARYGLSDQQAAGIIAVLSPQKDWYQNVSWAERILDITQSMRNYRWDDAMTKEAERIQKPKERKDFDAIKGKTLSEVFDNNIHAAMWIRVFDQTHNSRSYSIVTPEGGIIDQRDSKIDGGEKTLMWGTYGFASKAISIIKDGRAENIYHALGSEHKVQNFYNNIMTPNSPLGFVTIDTHAVAAAQLFPFGGSDLDVGIAWGGKGGSPKSVMTGLRGAYALYAEAYRRAGEEKGLLPREMQSITWEGVRTLFPSEDKKNKNIRGSAEAIWQQFVGGKLDLNQAQQAILQMNQSAPTGEQTNVPMDNTVRRSYAGLSQKTFDTAGHSNTTAPDSRPVIAAEVAPNPFDKELTARWNALSLQDKSEVTMSIANQIIPKVLSEVGVSGYVEMNIGGYLGDTNPSILLHVDRAAAAETTAKLLGYALSQNAMGILSDSPTVSTSLSNAVSVALPEGYGVKEITDLYSKLWQIKHNGKNIVEGYSIVDGEMLILNFSGIDNAEFAGIIDKETGGQYVIGDGTIHSALIEKEAYDYASSEKGSKGPGQRRADNLRRVASKLLEDELSRRTPQYSARTGNEGAMGRVRAERENSWGGAQEAQTPDPVSVTAVHFSQAKRTKLSTGFAGTGYAGAERNRLPKDQNSPINQRLYGYVNVGHGIVPEAGVGVHAHQMALDNLYDIQAGGLKTPVAGGMNPTNAFEQAIIDAGYNGWLDRSAGVACLLGPQEVSPNYLGVSRESYAGTPEVAPVKESANDKLADEVMATKNLPQGLLSGPRWAEVLKKVSPSLYQKFESSGKIAALESHQGDLSRREVAYVQQSGRDMSNVSPLATTPLYSIRQEAAPRKTIKAYKLLKVKKSQPGKLFPLFADKDKATDVGIWLDADVGKTNMSPRPGWHLGDLPIARHIGMKNKETGVIDRQAPDTVWAEVEVSADKDWQSEANSRARRKKDGSIVPSTAEIKDEIPKDGFYRYKTNSNMEGDWTIAGAIKINRVLSDSEVDQILRENGKDPMPREGGPIDLDKYGVGSQYSTAKGKADNSPVINIFRQYGATEIIENKDGSLTVKFPGKTLTVEVKENIPIDKKSWEKAHPGEPVPASGATGMYVNGKIVLQQDVAGKWVTTHEFTHFLQDAGILTKNDVLILRAKMQQEGIAFNNENLADFVADKIANVQQPTGLFGKIIAKVRDIFDQLTNAMGTRTASGVIRDIETGNIWKDNPVVETKTDRNIIAAAEQYFINNYVDPFLQTVLRTSTRITTGEAVELKAATKDTLRECQAYGLISADTPVRLTSVDELRGIVENGELVIGSDFEGHSGISAQTVSEGTPIVAYGPNDKVAAAIIFPSESTQGKGEQANEVLVNPDTDLAQLRFIVGDHKQLFTMDQLQELYAGDVQYTTAKEPGERLYMPGKAQKFSGKAFGKLLHDKEFRTEFTDILKHNWKNGVSDKDLSTWNVFLNIPAHIKDAAMQAAFYTQLDREKQRSMLVSEAMKQAQTVWDLYKESKTLLNTGDKKQLREKAQKEIVNLEKALIEGDLKHETYEAADLRSKFHLTARGIKAYTEIRTLLDTIWDERFEEAENALFAPFAAEPWYGQLYGLYATGKGNVKKKDLDTLPKEAREAYAAIKTKAETLRSRRKDIGNLKGFFPRSREEGKFYIAVKEPKKDENGNIEIDKKGNPVFQNVHMQFADSLTMAEMIRRDLVKRYKKNPEAIVEAPKANRKELEGTFFRISDQNTQRIVDNAIRRLQAKGTLSMNEADDMMDAVLEQISTDLKARGWGHDVKRAANYVGGYQTTALDQVFHDYITGHYGQKAKGEAAQKFMQILQEVSKQNKPKLFAEISHYSQSMLLNADKIDQYLQGARTIVFLKYLGMNVKSALVQVTQNYITAMPFLARYLKGYGFVDPEDIKKYGAKKAAKMRKEKGKGILQAEAIYHKAMADVARMKAKDPFGNPVENPELEKILGKDEASMIKHLFQNGMLDAQYVHEITMSVRGRFSETTGQLIELMSQPFAGMETWNRLSAAVAMVRAMKQTGDFKKKSFEESARMVEDYLKDTHYVMTKSNMPHYARGGDVLSKVAGTLYMFRRFQHNYLATMVNSLRKDENGKRHLDVIGRSLAYLVLLGGAAALLGDPLDYLEKITGKPYKAEVKAVMKKHGGETMMKVGWNGLPALLGTNITGSVAIQMPNLSDPEASVLGVWGGVGSDIGKAATSLSRGEYARMAESIAPTSLANLLKASRMYFGGATTIHGKPILDEEGKKMGLSGAEAIGQAMGFRPESTALAQENNATLQTITKHWTEERQRIYDLYRMADTVEGEEKAIAEKNKYNEEAPKYGLPKITGKSISRAMRTKQTKASKKFNAYLEE